MPPFEIPFRVVLERPLLVRDAAASTAGCDNVALLRGLEPPVPASSITGRLKEALRSFLRDASSSWPEVAACDGQDTGDPEQQHCVGHDKLCPMCRLFGRPGGRHRKGVDCSGAHYLPDDLNSLHRLHRAVSSKALSDFVLAPRGRHKRDERRRRALDDHLWTEGPAIALFDLFGVVQETSEHARVDETVREVDRCLLIAALRLVDSLGSHRTKSFGQCEVLPADGGIEQWRDALTAVRDAWVGGRS